MFCKIGVLLKRYENPEKAYDFIFPTETPSKNMTLKEKTASQNHV